MQNSQYLKKPHKKTCKLLQLNLLRLSFQPFLNLSKKNQLLFQKNQKRKRLLLALILFPLKIHKVIGYINAFGGNAPKNVIKKFACLLIPCGDHASSFLINAMNLI